jgi:hypothetical protein
MIFDALMKWLSGIAETLIENPHGPVEIRCQGIDASDPDVGQRRRRSSEKTAEPASRTV